MELPPDFSTTFIEAKALDEIVLGFAQDLDFHKTLFRISALAAFQSLNWD